MNFGIYRIFQDKHLQDDSPVVEVCAMKMNAHVSSGPKIEEIISEEPKKTI